MKFGKDPMDQYSIPSEVIQTDLSTIFEIPKRRKTEKPGRALSVVYDARRFLLSGFECRYTYLVEFDHASDAAGNHFHKTKNELYFFVSGKFTVKLALVEHPDIKESHTFDSNEYDKKGVHAACHIPIGVAHKVIAESDRAILLVLATGPGTEKDEIPFKID